MMTPLLSRADLFLAGENRGGINGLNKLLLAPPGETDQARLCAPLSLTARSTNRSSPSELDAWFRSL